MDIHELRDIFSKHAEQQRKRHHDQIVEFIKDNPLEDLPEYLSNDFNFPLALEVICQEIINLKNR